MRSPLKVKGVASGRREGLKERERGLVANGDGPPMWREWITHGSRDVKAARAVREAQKASSV
jgi:hypothetical protein